MAKTKTTAPFNWRIDSETRAKLKALAKADGRSMAGYLKKLIQAQAHPARAAESEGQTK